MKKIFYFKQNQALDELVDYLVSFKNLEAILLDGELGAGKTTLTAAIAKKLGEKKTIISPTFNTMICYDKFVHIDAYKLKGNLFAYEEDFENKLVIIEWAKNIEHNFKYYFSINVTIQTINEDIYHVFEITKKTCSKSLFIETSLEDFFVCIIENNLVTNSILIKNLIKKTDSFFSVIDEILLKEKTKLADLDYIYTTKGPGSFTGSRLGFLFASTNYLLQKEISNNDLEILLAPTYELFFKQQKKSIIYIKANKYKAYEISKKNGSITINLSDQVHLANKFDYDDFIKNPDAYLSLFKKVNSVLDEELVYASDPQIGGL
ncbi:tRNA (adenosine(37)-N6)-threonylcarbamoyltransferase complex ATPase subunit type 1 TsaE [Metamycoplasma alkalescens]|uniref:tRNA (adenosine(37)-N6)-threonylcarbamoyltransferase complex ATPase subunit type 1 TsaE n=1 Tax=Metamycoplasma alkalescens TaxID=45363 RepID=UPI003D06067D